MAAATEDRMDVFSKQLRNSVLHDVPVADSTENFYESTLVQLNASDEATNVDHTGGEDDSGVQILAAMEYQDDEPFTGKFQRDRAGSDPLVKLHSGVLLEFEIADSIGNYAVGDTAYAVDNQTVNASQGDGSGGNYAEAGTVYEVLDQKGTVKVYVPGILG